MRRVWIGSLLVGVLVASVAPAASAGSDASATKPCRRIVLHVSASIDGDRLGTAARTQLAAAAKALADVSEDGAAEAAAALTDADSQAALRSAVIGAARWCVDHRVGPRLSRLRRAKVEYLANAIAFNTAASTARGRMEAGEITESEFCGVLADALTSFSGDLRAYTDWPANAQDEIEALATITADDGSGPYRACANGERGLPSDDEDQGGADASAAVRRVLQLPAEQ